MEENEDFEVTDKKGSKHKDKKEVKKAKKGKKDKKMMEEMDKLISTEEEEKGSKKKGHQKKGKKKRGQESDSEEEVKVVPKAKDKEEIPVEEEKKKPEKKVKEEKKPYDPRMPVDVIYCGICNRPLEYCCFSPDPNACQLWAFKNAPEEYKLIYGDAAPEEKEEKKQTEEEKGGSKKKKKKVGFQDAKQVLIYKVSRGKSHCQTFIYGLHLFGVSLKEAAKLLRKEKATGCSVVDYEKDPTQQCLQIQGDILDFSVDFIQEHFSTIPEEALIIKRDPDEGKKKT